VVVSTCAAVSSILTAVAGGMVALGSLSLRPPCSGWHSSSAGESTLSTKNFCTRDSTLV